MHVQLAEDWRPFASLEAPAPVPPPAAVHSHPVEAPLGPGEGDDGVAEADAAFYFWCPEETPQDTAVADAADTAVADAAWVQQRDRLLPVIHFLLLLLHLVLLLHRRLLLLPLR